MPQRHLKGSKSLGIIGMKERMFQIGGEFNCSSEIGKGTRLEIKIPVGQ
jgi:signal transduction histidine kinase